MLPKQEEEDGIIIKEDPEFKGAIVIPNFISEKEEEEIVQSLKEFEWAPS